MITKMWNYPFNKWLTWSVSAARVSVSFLLLVGNGWNFLLLQQTWPEDDGAQLESQDATRGPVQSASPLHLSRRRRHWLVLASLSGAE